MCFTAAFRLVIHFLRLSVSLIIGRTELGAFCCFSGGAAALHSSAKDKAIEFIAQECYNKTKGSKPCVLRLRSADSLDPYFSQFMSSSGDAYSVYVAASLAVRLRFTRPQETKRFSARHKKRLSFFCARDTISKRAVSFP